MRIARLLVRTTVSTGRLVPARCFFSRHIIEPRLVINTPTSSDGKQLDVDPKKPVVLLLGWAGAKYSHVGKYAELYNRKGFRTVSFVAPCYHFRMPNSRYGFYVSPLFRAIDAKPGDFRSFADCPIIVHIFSLNGVRSLISFWKWTEAEQMTHLRRRIKGVIFDSAPAVTQAGPAAQAVVESTPPMDGFEWVNPELRRIYAKMVFQIRNAVTNPLIFFYPPARSFLSQYYWLQSQIELPKDQLYIYSESDTMVRHKYITRFAEEQKSRGKRVDTLFLPDSPHVQHFLAYPTEYKTACLDLIARSAEDE